VRRKAGAVDDPAAPIPHVACISLEPWDDVWRRNQHLASRLQRLGAVGSIDFVEPPLLRLRGPRHGHVRTPQPNITAVASTLRLPKRAGGLAELGGRLRRGPLRRADVLWINDPTLGVHCLRRGQPAVYDVTDDWRAYDFPERIRRRIVRAEDELARRAQTVVCSTELRDRWRDRYGIEPAVVHNGVDTAAWAAAAPRSYTGAAPHVGYVGTLQSERLDLDLLLLTADAQEVGTVHLVGPDALDSASRERVQAHPKIVLHEPVPTSEVASWTKGLDVLLSPHRLSSFTLSLDAIKSYEYLASGRPVVATPTSGFQHLSGHAAVHVAEGPAFIRALREVLGGAPAERSIDDLDWDARARQFADRLSLSLEGTAA
jgi:teichuronic acid biosynthesis glycosyltransferase TuaH